MPAVVLPGLNPTMVAVTTVGAWTIALVVLIVGLVYFYVNDAGSREYDLGRDLTSNGVLFVFISSVLSMLLYAGKS